MATKFRFYMADPFRLPDEKFAQYMKTALPQLNQWDADAFSPERVKDPAYRQAALKAIDQNFSCLNEEDEVSAA